MICFRVPGLPIPKGRPRMTTRGGRIRTFTPPATVSYERTVAIAAAEAMARRAPLEGPLDVSIFVELPVPLSWSKKKQEAALAGLTMPTGRPDLDNFVKAISDGGNGIAWRDDAQIVLLRASKRYAATPGVYVEVETIA